jgi:DUF2937 family protein
MFNRLFNGLSGLAGAGSLSQFPTYYQQDIQRLGGRLDQAEIQVSRIETVASEEGMTLPQYIEKFAGSADSTYQLQGAVLREEVADLDRLRAAVDVLTQAPPIERPWRLLQHIDALTARTALDDFALSLPLTAEGAIYAGIGLILGMIVLAILKRLLRGLFRRRSPA